MSVKKDLTQQEKLEFAKKINSNDVQDKLKYGRRYIISGYSWLIGGAVIIGAILISKIITVSFFLPLALLTWLEFSFVDLFRGYKASITAVKDASYDKISYMQYKKLLKTGELATWAECDAKLKSGSVADKTEQEKKDMQKLENVKEQDGVTLTAEEVAVLRKLIDKKIVKSVEKSDKTENPS